MSNLGADMSRIGDRIYRRPLEESFCITAMKRINADRRRVFHALTVPEYIEAWFSAPGLLIGQTMACRWDRFLSISYSDVKDQRCRILCSYKVCRRSRLQFAWKRDGDVERQSSWVRIRLQGDFGRTTLQVSHFGLDHRERQWHHDLWEASLETLCKLF